MPSTRSTDPSSGTRLTTTHWNGTGGLSSGFLTLPYSSASRMVKEDCTPARDSEAPLPITKERWIADGPGKHDQVMGGSAIGTRLER